MRVKIYQYKNCSTCRNALKFLAARGIEAEAADITVKPPSLAELKGMLARYDGHIKKLFNTSGESYRAAGLGAKLDGMSESAALKLLQGDGKLVKRPFLIIEGMPSLVGFKVDEWEEALG